jgi:hypothetical protein
VNDDEFVECGERIQEKLTAYSIEVRKSIQDDYSRPVLPSESDHIDLKSEDIIDTEDENADNPSTVIETKLRDVMTQGEIEILTTLFPKASNTLASVLRKRLH